MLASHLKRRYQQVDVNPAPSPTRGGSQAAAARRDRDRNGYRRVGRWMALLVALVLPAVRFAISGFLPPPDVDEENQRRRDLRDIIQSLKSSFPNMTVAPIWGTAMGLYRGGPLGVNMHDHDADFVVPIESFVRWKSEQKRRGAMANSLVRFRSAAFPTIENSVRDPLPKRFLYQKSNMIPKSHLRRYLARSLSYDYVDVVFSYEIDDMTIVSNNWEYSWEYERFDLKDVSWLNETVWVPLPVGSESEQCYGENWMHNPDELKEMNITYVQRDINARMWSETRMDEKLQKEYDRLLKKYHLFDR